jgi:spermidine/putrescine-binding protein
MRDVSFGGFQLASSVPVEVGEVHEVRAVTATGLVCTLRARVVRCEPPSPTDPVYISGWEAAPDPDSTSAKKTLLAYDDTTFYSKLVSGEAVLVEAWDGWCNYGIAENADIKFVIPKEGSDLWVDTMVVLAASENKEAAHKFIDYVLRPEIGEWVASNILYKVPSKPVVEKLDPALIEQFPNLGMTPAELLKQEALEDVGDAQKMYTQLATEIAAGQ